MNLHLLNRALGALGPQAFERAEKTRLLHALQPTTRRYGVPSSDNGGAEDLVAHRAGVSSITIDKFEGRYLLSGGADSSISMWDLESISDGSVRFLRKVVSHPSCRTSIKHNLGITHLSFYAFDSGAFLSSSYDHTLKLYNSETMETASVFDLGAVVYSHSMSPIAHHNIVACATQGPNIRLVNLNSGSASHALPGHAGAVLSTAWSPVHEHRLASAGADGTVRFWDIRKSASCLGLLDSEDSIGIQGIDGVGGGARSRQRGRAHMGAANGVIWTEDGRHVVTTGHDNKVRVWDTITGANTLVNFGPLIKNSHLTTLLPLIAPSDLTRPGKEVLFYPNPNEIMAYEMLDGTMIKRLRVPARPTKVGGQFLRGPGFKTRTTALAWRAHDVELYSAHSDGCIRAWAPRTQEDMLVDDEEIEEIAAEAESRERKRK
ncbi:WD40 repeat-like protein, partial [Saccharata proteae CBS 121410]